MSFDSRVSHCKFDDFGSLFVSCFSKVDSGLMIFEKKIKSQKSRTEHYDFTKKLHSDEDKCKWFWKPHVSARNQAKPVDVSMDSDLLTKTLNRILNILLYTQA